MSSQTIDVHKINYRSSTTWRRWEYENPNVKQSNNRGNSWKNRENQITEKRITTEEGEEITNGIRKNKENKV